MISEANAKNKVQTNFVHLKPYACPQISLHVIFVSDSSTVLKFM